MRAKQECNTHALPMHMACSWLRCRIGRFAPSPAAISAFPRPAILNSTFFILHSPRAHSAGALPPRFQKALEPLPPWLARRTSRPG